MTKWLVIISIAVSLLTANLSFAEKNGPSGAPGPLFTLSWTGNNLSINTTKSAWFYQFSGIKSLTPEFSFSNCTMSDNGHCLFSVSNTITALPVLAGPAIKPAFIMCLNGVGNTYSCERNQLGDRFAYVSSFTTTTVLLCPISSNGTLGACDGSGYTNVYPAEQIAINKAETIAYVGNKNDNKVLVCTINSNGRLSACTDSENSGIAFDSPSGIVLNSSGTLAYVTNQNNFVSVCPIKGNGSFGACRDSGNTGGAFESPNGIALNTTETMAYVANASGNTVSKCPINTDGNFGACSDSGNTGTTFNQPIGIALSATGTMAYVANNGLRTVSKCPINTDGNFGVCTDSGAGEAFRGPYGIALNATGTMAYVANSNNNTVSKCPINTDGSFGVCTGSGNTGTAFTNPSWITLF
jgi:DNA-binding beta-propeller fold protein YncE